MKTILIAAILSIFSLTSFSQSRDLTNIYYNYKGEEGVTSLHIPGILLRLAGSLADLDSQERQLLRSMRSIQVLAIEDSNLNSRVNFVNEVNMNNLGNGYNLLLQIKDGKDDVVILGREKRGALKDLVVLVGGNENVMVRIRGRMKADLMGSLAEVAGIEELRFTKEI